MPPSSPIRKNGVALKAPITTPVGTGFRSINVYLRQSLDLYACLRPCKSYKGVRSKYEDIDLVIVRENTEDLYAGIEFQKSQADTLELIDWLNRHSKTQDHAGLRHQHQADLRRGHRPHRALRVRLCPE